MKRITIVLRKCSLTLTVLHIYSCRETGPTRFGCWQGRASMEAFSYLSLHLSISLSKNLKRHLEGSLLEGSLLLFVVVTPVLRPELNTCYSLGLWNISKTQMVFKTLECCKVKNIEKFNMLHLYNQIHFFVTNIHFYNEKSNVKKEYSDELLIKILSYLESKLKTFLKTKIHIL